ncbi:MAG TPA: hypothetical protein VKK81_10705 [Candidatus Binatia bacterium]|nr:hypothetical protein [Candidatus Binatia bacterium]
MHRFGRQCRGQGKVFVRVVRQTETQLLESGQPVVELARAAPECVQRAGHLPEGQRTRLDTQLPAVLTAPQQIASQSRRLTKGKPLLQGKLLNAYDLPIAPICQGKSNCPTPFGRKPGILAEPASGFIFAFQLPIGNPTDPSSVLPVVDKVQHAIEQVSRRPSLAIHALAGDLALNDTTLREVLHRRGILTVGIPHTLEPLTLTPTPEEVRRMLTVAGLNTKRTPHPAHIACACGYSRPMVESIIASLRSRGAARLTYKGHRGASVQTGMTVRAHNAATMVRIQHNRLSKRAQKLRRLLRLKRHNINQFHAPKI